MLIKQTHQSSPDYIKMSNLSVNIEGNIVFYPFKTMANFCEEIRDNVETNTPVYFLT